MGRVVAELSSSSWYMYQSQGRNGPNNRDDMLTQVASSPGTKREIAAQLQFARGPTSLVEPTLFGLVLVTILHPILPGAFSKFDRPVSDILAVHVPHGIHEILTRKKASSQGADVNRPG